MNSRLSTLIKFWKLCFAFFAPASHFVHLQGRGWWREQEEPWQTLACCRELTAALRHPGSPTTYINRFPVHQDGSCNGLQHYAAIGRDERGALSVSLVDCERPRDVYTDVTEVVSSI